ncbi:hypothetical protein HCB39_26970 [Salinispora arenicola]|nr:hypothetical protein [Salinispora arenicola]
MAAPLVAVAVPGVPWLLSAGREEQRTIARVEAVEAWTRRLRDVEDSGVGLQEAIVDTAQTAPAAIAADVAVARRGASKPAGTSKRRSTRSPRPFGIRSATRSLWPSRCTSATGVPGWPTR